MQNSYYDGPFDQLADNYVNEDSKLSEFIQLAYTYTKGLIDEYGNFIDDDGFRVAIMPYYIYEVESELIDLVEGAKATASGDEFYSIITYDFQKGMIEDLEFELEDDTETFEEVMVEPEVMIDTVPVPIVPSNAEIIDQGSTRCSKNKTYHVKCVTYLPGHTKNVTWPKHITNVTWSKWQHIKCVTWQPHRKCVTWTPHKKCVSYCKNFKIIIIIIIIKKCSSSQSSQFFSKSISTSVKIKSNTKSCKKSSIS